MVREVEAAADTPFAESGTEEHTPFNSEGLSHEWFAQLAGTWALQRRIVQATDALPQAVAARPRGLQSSARLRGTAHFDMRDATTFAYREEGLLTMGDGTVVNAVRRYLYKLVEGVLIVEFDDGPNQGQRFLTLDARDESPAAAADQWRLADNHLCGRDLYQAEYRFEGFASEAQRLRIVQRTSVSGPRKDYAIVSILRRG